MENRVTEARYRLLTYRGERGERAGALIAGDVFDIADATGRAGDASVLGLLADWPVTHVRLKEALKAGVGKPVADAQLCAPLPTPGAIYCAGANYSDHAAEMAARSGTPSTKTERSWHFVKSARTVVGSGAVVALPEASHQVDWEIELAAVIGRRGKHIALADALGHVAGYTVANDLSARDLSRRAEVAVGSPFKMDWLSHKNFDGACPLGPWITPAEWIDDPQALAMQLSINGVMKQDSNTSAMIFSLAEQIRDLSERITLWPGDVILTGTPAGVGLSRDEFLKPGDVMRARIEGLGELVTEMK
jgi:2-keto-4-pentenoate hydratase/2-oxohepta-3-ene-1,7-dioic acid hydratase in catechol pathway